MNYTRGTPESTVRGFHLNPDTQAPIIMQHFVLVLKRQLLPYSWDEYMGSLWVFYAYFLNEQREKTCE